MNYIFDPNKNKMTDMQLAKLYVDEFLRSPERKMMLDGEAYYVVENPEIMNRKMYRYQETAGGEPQRVVDPARPNNKRAHGFMHEQVEDKINYLLAKPYTLTCDGHEEYLDQVQKLLGRHFQDKRFMKLGVDASNGGIGWLHVYIDEKGDLKTVTIKPGQIIPLWNDSDHEDLWGLIWFYDVSVIEGLERKIVTKVQFWKPDGVAYYETEGGAEYRLDVEKYFDEEDQAGDFIGHFRIDGKPAVWGKVPFIPFKNNDYELPDLQFIKTLIDGYDKSRSDVANMFDDVKSTVYALKGYGGQDLSQFMKELNYYRAISLDDDGEASTLNANTDVTSIKEDFDTLRKDIYDFGMAVDKNSDRFGNSPSGIALKFIYSGLDLKCNRMENAFRLGFEMLMWFVNEFMLIKHMGGNHEYEVSIMFNRDIAINESQAILDCQNSKGVISDETIILNHPWTTDVEVELDRMKEKQMELPMFDMNKRKEDEDDEDGKEGGAE